MFHEHLLDGVTGLGGHEAERPRHDQGRPGGAVQPLEAVNARHGGEVVSLPLRLVLGQVALLTQAPALPEAVFHNGGQRGHVPEPEVDSLPRQRVDSVGGVTEEDGPRSNVAVRVTKAKGEGSPVKNS